MLALLARFGRGIMFFFAEFGGILTLLKNVIKYIPNVVKDRKLIIEQMVIVGTDSLPLVILIGAFTGAIAALEATLLFSKFNLINITRPFLGASIATAVFTELTPVLTALVIAGRVGGSMAAQLGTMAVSEQIDALDMMAIDKDRFLAMPRVLSALLMMPVLAVFSNIVALGGSYVLTAIKFDFSAYEFFTSIQTYFSTKEVFISISKSLTFGVTTALIGCYVGFRTSGGAEGVGKSTVRAFTLSASAILVLDALFGYVL
jgi:phospholipid/cholesterol/gamma-HCH transport system permease protein